MEIQSFMLCKEVFKSGAGTMHDGRMLGITRFFPVDKGYPLTFTVDFFMLTHREHCDYDEEFSIRFDLVDEDCRPAGEPAGFKYKGTFPSGARFYRFCGDIRFIIPSPGIYRLDITADEEGRPSVYAYNIEATLSDDVQ